MKLVTRAQLGWPASAAPTQSSTRGVKVHYEGTAVSTKLLTDHDACLAEWKNIRRSHLANTAENYSDVAYNYAACPHGYLLEGRGLRKRTGANGNQALNQAHYAILGLVGSSGLTEPTAAMLAAIRDGIDLLRENGAGGEIKGHRDGYATACPGGPLYAWVKKGAPRPSTTPETTPAQVAEEEDPMPAPKVITESVPASDRLPAGKYTLVKMAADTAALQGPCTYTATAYATITGTPGTRVTARWHDLPLSTGRPSLDLPIDGGLIGPDGVLNLSVTRTGGLSESEQLRIELRSDTDATVTRRVLRALRTDA